MNTEQILQNIFHNFELLKRNLWKKYSHAELPLTRAQMGLMIFIDECGPQAVTNIAQHWNMSSSAVTQMIDTLVDRSLVTRRQSQEDRRRIQISITKKGTEILATAKSIRLKQLEELLSPLSAQELESLEKMQQKVLDTFHID